MMRHICLEPRVGQQILYAMIEEARKTAPLDLALRTTVTQVLKQGDTVTGAVVQTGPDSRNVQCRMLIDATEWGDVIPLTGAPYRVGNCTSERIDPGRGIQFLTWTAVIKEYPRGVPAPLLLTKEPTGYTPQVRATFVKTLQVGDAVQASPFDAKTRPWSFATFIGYRGMPDSASLGDAPPITRTHMNFNNDYPVYVRDVEDRSSRSKECREAQLRTLRRLYYIQHTLGKTGWSVADDEGFDTPFRRAEVDAWLKDVPELEPYRTVLQHFSIIPYVRESRRITGLHTLTAREIERKPGTPSSSPAHWRLAIIRSTCTGRWCRGCWKWTWIALKKFPANSPSAAPVPLRSRCSRVFHSRKARWLSRRREEHLPVAPGKWRHPSPAQHDAHGPGRRGHCRPGAEVQGPAAPARSGARATGVARCQRHSVHHAPARSGPRQRGMEGGSTDYRNTACWSRRRAALVPTSPFQRSNSGRLGSSCLPGKPPPGSNPG